MKKELKEGFRKRYLIRMFASLTLIAIIGGSGSYVFGQYMAMADFAFEHPPDPSTFKVVNENMLANAAEEFELRYSLYHHPLNQTSAAVFHNDSAYNGGVVSYTNVSSYSFGDNEALFTGIDYAAWTYKYLTAKAENDAVSEQFAYDMLINLTTGLSLLMAVPNGGLGSNYSGILGRGVCPPDQYDIWPYIFTDQPKHFNGSGIYSQWRYRAYTSNDEFGGYYLFLALATKYLSDIDFINTRVSLIVDQLCNYMIKNNFLGIHGTGALTGVDQKPRMFAGGFWAPLLLKMGAIHHPEKYESIYYHYVGAEMYHLSASEGGPQEIFANYYAFNFGLCVCMAFLLLEDSSTEIWKVYFKGYYDTLWHDTRYHRNAWSNAIFLMICNEAGIMDIDIEDDLAVISRDIGDQLMRFTDAHLPNRLYEIPDELPEGYSLHKPIEEFARKLNMSPEVQKFLGIKETQLFVNKPLTVDMQPARGWAWSRSPYSWDPNRNYNPLIEFQGTSFLVPYWMMRYMGYIKGGA